LAKRVPSHQLWTVKVANQKREEGKGSGKEMMKVREIKIHKETPRPTRKKKEIPVGGLVLEKREAGR